MSTIMRLDSTEPFLQMGLKPAAIIFISPEGIVGIQWFEACSPEEQQQVEEKLNRGVRFGDLE